MRDDLPPILTPASPTITVVSAPTRASFSILPPVQERPRVLVVDDEKFIRDILADFLGMEGYEVRTAEDGVCALQEMQRHPYDVVISDLKMPKMGGIELLDEIGRRTPNVLTVIMTGFGTVETAIDAMKRGAYDYVLKPFKVEEVVHIIQRALEKQRLSAENLRLREAVSLYKVSEAIAASLSLDEVMATVCDTALHEIRADFVSTWLDDGEGGFFERNRVVAPPRGSVLPPAAYDPLAPDMLPRPEPAHLEDTTTQPILNEVDPEVVRAHLAVDSMLLEHGVRGHRFFKDGPGKPTQSVIGVPLRAGGAAPRLIGWILAASFTAGRRFDEGQRKLLSIVGSRAAAAIDNARLYEDLKATFKQTIQGLARALDRLDRYTSGHSDRVAMYATMLAIKLALPPELIEIVRQSALMHDIGKIGCVLNLNKPGKLTNEDYEAFKRHPAYGRDILEPIKFLQPLIPGVHLHHERWDGRGYPLGLAGNDIPLIARIVAVADTYDAMTSDRAYRRALPHEVTITEIERCSGTQFDRNVAASFLEAIEEFRAHKLDAGETIPE
ncbi:MAG: response regulator [Deltaproteobacteria bacterium]|nr:response regulator [Deltaproteobacteria bacterium]